MMKPTTTPRWLQMLTHGALIITILVGVISYGRSSGRTEAALANYTKVPALQADVASTNQQLAEIKGILEKQNDKTNQGFDQVNKRMDNQQQQIIALSQVDAKVNTLTGQMGTIFALEQSNSNSVHELKGTLNAILQQQQHPKEK